MASRFKRLLRVLATIEDGLLTLALTATLTLAIGQILLRNIWHQGISWGDPATRVLVLWIALLGAMVATRHGNHIRIDIIPRYLPILWRSRAKRLTDLFATLVCANLAWFSGRFVRFEYEDGNLLFASVPAWACELILPLGFGVMAARFFVSTFADHPPEPLK